MNRNNFLIHGIITHLVHRMQVVPGDEILLGQAAQVAFWGATFTRMGFLPAKSNFLSKFCQ